MQFDKPHAYFYFSDEKKKSHNDKVTQEYL